MLLRRTLLASPLLLAATSAHAQWAPKQPIHVIVGFAPGGTADITARLAGEAIQRRTGTTVVVDSKTGALGFIGLKAVANAAPDGYTVGIGIMGQLAVAPVVPGSQIGFDLDKELVPLCNLVGVPMALIVRPNAPYKTVAELRKHVAGMGSDRYLAPEMATVVVLAQSGALVRAARTV